ncbi:MAG: VIT and VWA domain-containing protein [Labilithrix sp.]
MSKRATLTVRLAMLCAVLFVLLAPRTARAGGALLVANDANDPESRNAELPLERTDVDVDVSGSIVGATVTQRFKNTRSTPIEVVYLFPLAQRAAVDAMEMKVGTRTIIASIARREEARAAYQSAVREGRRAALLEQERPNMFTFSVGNIDAGATIDVKLHYFEVAQFDHGTYEIVVPTTIGPRFIPAKGVPDANRIQTTYTKTPATIGIHVKVDGGTAIESVATPAWETNVTRPSATVADVTLKRSDERPDRDFTLRWRLKAESFEPALFTHRAPGSDSGYLTLMLEPKHDIALTEIAPRELVFLLDTSGSMHGAPLTTAIMAVNKAIDKLGPQDTFQIIDFADRASTFAPRPLPNTPENRKKGHDYVNDLRSAGGTNQLAGIHAALSTPGDDLRTRYVVFMTDGFIGNDEEVIALTRREIGKAHVFSFGVGSSVNRYLLDEVAIAGRGYAEYMRAHTAEHNASEDMNELVERFYTRIGLPFLTDIEIDWGNLASAVSDARPRALPDLSALQPLVLHARYSRAGEGDVTIKGKVGGKPRTQKLHVVLPAVEAGHAEIEKLWARETIADMERVKRGTLDVEGITKVALKHGLMSKYTAFVGTDSTGPKDANGAPTRVQQPSAAPADVDLSHAGGTMPDASPAPVSARYEAMEMRRGGGCAGCTTAHTTTGRPAIAAFLLLGFVFVIRRRRARS